MSNDRIKRATEWFYENIFRDESIRPREKEPQTVPLPSLLRTARSLETGMGSRFQSREALFLKQAKLLADYEDDAPWDKPVMYYFPTYASLKDGELRGYFTWRTQLRRGNWEKTSLSFAYLYIYELLNGIGISCPREGYDALVRFREHYVPLDDRVAHYLDAWITDYVVYHRLDPNLLARSPQVRYDRCITVLQNIQDQSTAKVMDAVKTLAPRWLGRSKFYREYQPDCDEIIVRVLRRMETHYATRCKKGMIEQFFGERQVYPTELFVSALFCGKKSGTCTYVLDEQCVYQCRGGRWTVEKYSLSNRAEKKLNDLMKTMDAVMREEFGYASPIRQEAETKWILKLIHEETRNYLAEKKREEEKKVTIDFSRLDRIRREAALTQERLTVEEEEWEPAVTADPAPAVTPDPAPVYEQAENTAGLDKNQYRLLQCLLYGYDTGWLRSEGHMVSVLVDGINETLCDTFADTVLDDSPAVIEDYIDDLKEMVNP